MDELIEFKQNSVTSFHVTIAAMATGNQSIDGRNKKVIEVSPIIGEIIKDAIEESDWKSSSILTVFVTDDSGMGQYSFSVLTPAYIRGDWKIAVDEPYDKVVFYGVPSILVDATADLITDADKVEALIEWIYEGGQFPLTKGENNETLEEN